MQKETESFCPQCDPKAEHYDLGVRVEAGIDDKGVFSVQANFQCDRCGYAFKYTKTVKTKIKKQ